MGPLIFGSFTHHQVMAILTLSNEEKSSVSTCPYWSRCPLSPTMLGRPLRAYYRKVVYSSSKSLLYVTFRHKRSFK